MVLERSNVGDRLRPYLPRLTLEWLASAPDERHRSLDGSVVFVDISGFTKLSEKLARFGRVGAEEMADSIDRCFADLLAIAYEGNGSLLKFGGDALLLLFSGDDDHVAQAVRAAHRMRARLRTVGKLATTGGRVQLRMSVGVHTGRFDFFLVGDSHVELLVTGPATTGVARMEGTAEAGEIVISPDVAEVLAARHVGAAKGPGFLLRSAPPGDAYEAAWIVPDALPDELLLRSVSVATREHLLEASAEPEHRQATVAFIHFDGTDGMIERDGGPATATALHRLVSDVQEAVDHHGVCFLGSDADADGGKLILVAGAPLAKGDDEERMLLALRRIAERDHPVPIRIGVNHGSVFAGDVGPPYRRTYTVMGDTVNLAARLMAKAPPGEIYATASVLDRSPTRFATVELEPFSVKGKAKPIDAWSVGAPVGSRTREGAGATHLRIVGRVAEITRLGEALDDAREGRGTLVEIVGEPGVGKSRLLEELQERADGFTRLTATAEAYTSSTPYVIWRELLRELLEVPWDAPDDLVLERLLTEVEAIDPELWTWLPLLAIALDVDMALTLEVEVLTPELRRTKLHDVIERLLGGALREPTLFVIEDGHLMDGASAELLASLAERLDGRPWVVAIARRDTETGFHTPTGERIVTLRPGPLDPDETLELAKLATAGSPMLPHDLRLVADRSAGNPQFLLDLAGAVAGGTMLPDSIEAAATATIDNLHPGDRTLVRRASVLGVSFHERHIAEVLEPGASIPDASTWRRLGSLFERTDVGYVRFRRAVMRDAAYGGLPFRTRRQLHGRVAHRYEREADVEEAGGLLSLHFFLAGLYEEAWPYARTAAHRAVAQFAHHEAAQLFRRAIDAARRIDVDPRELAAVREARADALKLAGEYERAGEELGQTRRLIRGDEVWEARLMLKRSRLEERLGRYPQALRWASRGLALIEGSDSDDAKSERAALTAWYAAVLQAEGRQESSIAWAERAVTAASDAGNDDALGSALNVLGMAHGFLGRPGAEEYFRQAHDAYGRSGDIVAQADVLSQLGLACQWAGRWQEAIANWERARDESLRIQDEVGAAVPEMNIGEVLSDRGQLVEADDRLQALLPLWRASGYRYFLGYCLGLLGRVAYRRGRFGDAMERLEEAKSNFLHVHAEEEVLDVDARTAECLVFRGTFDDALALAERTLRRADSLDGVPMVVPVLERVRAYAKIQAGDLVGADEAFRASLQAARARSDRFETALTLLGLVRLASKGVTGIDVQTHRAESGALLTELGVRSVPAVPLTGI